MKYGWKNGFTVYPTILMEHLVTYHKILFYPKVMKSVLQQISSLEASSIIYDREL